MFKRILKLLISKKIRNDLRVWLQTIKDKRILNKQISYKYHWFKKEFITQNFKYELVLSKRDRRSCRVIEKKQQPKIDLIYEKFQNQNYDFFIDLGTNYGEFSIPMSSIVNKVISIEPHPEVYRTFLETKKKFKNIDSFQNGFFDRITKIDLFKDNVKSGGSFVEGAKEDLDGFRKISVLKYLQGYTSDLNNKYRDIIEIETINFEFLNKIYNFSNKKIIVKIDVEGFDLQFMSYLTNCFLDLDLAPKFFIMAEIGSNYKSKKSINKLSEFINFCLKKNLNIFDLKNKTIRNNEKNLDKIYNIEDYISSENFFESGELIVSN